MINNQEILNAALEGLELQRIRLEEQIALVRKMIGGGGAKRGPKPRAAAASEESPGPVAKKSKKKGKRNLSPEARERIALAQKKRWAAHRGEA